MVLATLLIVAILMWINFARLRWTVLALLPLLVGVLWMLLLMDVLGMRLNFYNMVVLPAVIWHRKRCRCPHSPIGTGKKGRFHSERASLHR